MDRAEQEAIAAGRERFDLARLEALLEANPGTYAQHEQSLRRSYYLLVTRLKTMEDLADHVREMTVWGFWEVG
ncbi:MAG TPA: hypothetical protein VFL29_15085 [Candidatus Dormibacteraeota bacterium]|nr:hypothetical protein [Candidatus Dormibacteraeota bacterium]